MVQYIYIYIYIYIGECPKDPCIYKELQRCNAGECIPGPPPPEPTLCNLPGCDVCSNDGKICYSCIGDNSKLVVDDMTSYWKHGADKCSNTCEDNYNAFGFVKFVYTEEGQKPVHVKQNSLCLKSNLYIIYIYIYIDYPCTSGGSFCDGRTEEIMDCYGYCDPRFQCPDENTSPCDRCYPGIQMTNRCLNCEYGMITLDWVDDYVYNHGSQCSKCDKDKSARYTLEYYLYGIQIVADICLHDGI